MTIKDSALKQGQQDATRGAQPKPERLFGSDTERKAYNWGYQGQNSSTGKK